MSNPLLNASKQAHINAVRAIQHSPADHYPTVAAGLHAIADTLPEKLPGLADFARRPFSEIVTLIMLAASGGALVGGILIPVAYEIAQGKFNALPYSLWGVSLWLACAGWLRGKRWLPFLWFTGILLIISSWV